jgi:hypothetical protein
MKTSEIFLTLLIVVLLSSLIYDVSKNHQEQEARAYIQTHHTTIKNKEKRHTGPYEEYYIVCSDGYIDEVDFDFYLKCNIGDQITYRTKHYREINE